MRQSRLWIGNWSGKVEDADVKESLLSRVLKICELERDEGETAEAFKLRIVRKFSDQFPPTESEDDHDPFDDLDEDIRDWVDTTTAAVKRNKGARNPSRLPALEGLEEDPEPEKSVRKSSGKVKSSDKSAATGKGENEPKGTFGAKKELAETFEAAPVDAHVSNKLTPVLKDFGYKRSDTRSKAGHIVYKTDGGDEVHIGPGKGEARYLMGWCAPGQTKHSYGGDSLREYLAGKHKKAA